MSVLKSRHEDQEIPEKDFYSFVFQGYEKCLDKTAVIDHATGERVTYGSLVAIIKKLAFGLHKQGIGQGDVVCFFAEKSILGVAVIFSLAKLGAIMTPCRPSHTARELKTQLVNSGSKLLICDKHLVARATAAVKETPGVQKILTVAAEEGHESLERLVAQHDATGEAPKVSIDPKKDLLAIIYSSGTTGLPKGVKISHFNMVAHGITTSHASMKFFATDVFLQIAPPYHIAGLMYMTTLLHTKKILVLCEATSLQEYMKIVKQYEITSVGVFANHLIELSRLSQEALGKFGLDFSKVMLFTGGTIFNAVNSNQVLANAKPKCLIQAYGSTECGFVTTDDEEDFVPGSAGLVAPNTLLKIVDINTKDTLGPHQSGEIWVKGPSVTFGYLNNEKATADAFEDGWFKTGDVGYYDETEHLFIVDRIKDVIKYKTMQVSPSEIEEVIYQHSAVKATCVVGVENDEAGEVPLACVILKEGQTVSEEEIIQLVADHLADYKDLRGGVRFIQEFPLTGIGKVLRRELRDQVIAELKQK